MYYYGGEMVRIEDKLTYKWEKSKSDHEQYMIIEKGCMAFWKNLGTWEKMTCK